MRSVIMKAKVCLVGEAAVGKTSLIRRYVLDQYDDRYETTLGAKVTKKELRIPIKEKHLEVQLDLTIWDVMGDDTFRELLTKAYFAGARGVLAVADLTRRKTLEGVSGWIPRAVPVLPPGETAQLRRVHARPASRPAGHPVEMSIYHVSGPLYRERTNA